MNATTIRTSSKNQFERICKYINNKRISFVPSVRDNSYAITLFDLNHQEVDTLIEKMTRHFHLRKLTHQESMVGRNTSYTYWQHTVTAA